MAIYVLFQFNLFLVTEKKYFFNFPYGPMLNLSCGDSNLSHKKKEENLRNNLKIIPVQFGLGLITFIVSEKRIFLIFP